MLFDINFAHSLFLLIILFYTNTISLSYEYVSYNILLCIILYIIYYFLKCYNNIQVHIGNAEILTKLINCRCNIIQYLKYMYKIKSSYMLKCLESYKEFHKNRTEIIKNLLTCIIEKETYKKTNIQTSEDGQNNNETGKQMEETVYKTLSKWYTLKEDKIVLRNVKLYDKKNITIGEFDILIVKLYNGNIVKVLKIIEVKNNVNDIGKAFTHYQQLISSVKKDKEYNCVWENPADEKQYVFNCNSFDMFTTNEKGYYLSNLYFALNVHKSTDEFYISDYSSSVLYTLISMITQYPTTQQIECYIHRHKIKLPILDDNEDVFNNQLDNIIKDMILLQDFTFDEVTNEKISNAIQCLGRTFYKNTLTNTFVLNLYLSEYPDRIILYSSNDTLFNDN